MKKSQLKNLIREEVQSHLSEQALTEMGPEDILYHISEHLQAAASEMIEETNDGNYDFSYKIYKNIGYLLKASDAFDGNAPDQAVKNLQKVTEDLWASETKDLEPMDDIIQYIKETR